MEQFLQQLQTIPETAELIRRVEEGGCRQRSADCSRCSGPAWAPRWPGERGRPAVFVCGDEREVRQLSGDLRTLMEQEPVQLLAREWQFRPGAVSSREWERSRLAALYALARGQAPVVVTTADALMARTLPPQDPAGPDRHHPNRRTNRSEDLEPDAAFRGLYPLRSGGRCGAVCPAGRHSGRFFPPDGAAGAL